jgi:hypothetical protein
MGVTNLAAAQHFGDPLAHAEPDVGHLCPKRVCECVQRLIWFGLGGAGCQRVNSLPAHLRR